jgi:hypothetical protein
MLFLKRNRRPVDQTYFEKSWDRAYLQCNHIRIHQRSVIVWDCLD